MREWLRDRWHDIKGNVTYDLVKWFIFSIVITSLSGILQKLRHVSVDWFVLVGLFVVSLAGLIWIGRRQSHGSQRNHAPSAMHAAEPPSPKAEELEKELQAVRDQRLRLEQELAQLAPKRKAPDLIIDWQSLGESPHWDKITFRIVGEEPAICPKLESFSENCLQLHYPLELATVYPGEPKTREVYFNRWRGQTLEIGYLRSILSNPLNDDDLYVVISYMDTRGTRYRRRFLLRLVQAGRDLAISCEPGPIEVERAAATAIGGRG